MKISQSEKLYNLLKDYQEHSTTEILREVYGGEHLGIARISARIHDLKKKYGVRIEGRTDTVNPAIYHYRMSK